MKLAVLVSAVCLALASPASFGQDSDEYALDGHSWIVNEVRVSEDHWVSREEWYFEDETGGKSLLVVLKTCRTSKAPIILEVPLLVKMDAHSFTVLNSEDDRSTSGIRGYCSVSIRRGVYKYKVSADRDTVTVRDSKGVHVWTNHDRPEYDDGGESDAKCDSSQFTCPTEPKPKTQPPTS